AAAELELVLLEPLDPHPTPTVITAATIIDRTATRPADPLTISTPLLLLRRSGMQGIALRRRPVRPAGSIRTSAVCRMPPCFSRFHFGSALDCSNRNRLTTGASRERVRGRTLAAARFRSKVVLACAVRAFATKGRKGSEDDHAAAADRLGFRLQEQRRPGA